MTQSLVPTIVEDLFLTETFLIKGRISNKYQRLAKMLEDYETGFLQVQDATMVSLLGTEVIRTPSVLVNPTEIIFAHELVDVAGDGVSRSLADNSKTTRIRAFYNGATQLELLGKVEANAYDPNHNSKRRYFTMVEPVLRGLDITGNENLNILKDLSYAIVQKSKLAYIYDFS